MWLAYCLPFRGSFRVPEVECNKMRAWNIRHAASQASPVPLGFSLQRVQLCWKSQEERKREPLTIQWNVIHDDGTLPNGLLIIKQFGCRGSNAKSDATELTSER